MDLYDVRRKLSQGNSIYDLPLRVTYYARVSTDKDEQLHSIENQISYYESHIRKCSNWTFVDGYIDEGKSGTSVKHRENFLRMIDDAKNDKFDFILTKEISRFSRSTMDSIKYTQELLVSGVGVLFQSDNINTLLPDSELRLTIMSSIAQDEVRKLSERVKFGFKQAVDKGVVLGNSKIWGYDKVCGKLIINEQEAEIVRRIFDLYVNNKIGLRAISAQLQNESIINNRTNKPFGLSTLRSIVANPKYKGYYCGNKTTKLDYRRETRKAIPETEWVMYKDETGDTVPQIISEEMWDKAQAILHKRGSAFTGGDTKRYSNRYTYSGKIVCMEHQTSFHRKVAKYENHSREYWVCKEYVSKGRSGCTTPTIYTSELNEIMKKCVDNMILSKTEIIKEMIATYKEIGVKSKAKSNIEVCRNEIQKILNMKDTLLELNMNAKIDDDEFADRNNNYNLKIAEYKYKIEELQQEIRKNDEILEAISTLNEIIGSKLQFNDEITGSVIETLLDRIEVHKSNEPKVIKIEIVLKLVREKFPISIDRSRKDKTSFIYTPYT